MGAIARRNFEMKYLLLFSVLFLGTVFCKELFSRSASSLSRSSEPCCDLDTLSCYDVDVDPESLLSEEDISINGMELAFSNTIPPHGRVYKTEHGDEAVISLNEETGNIFGTLKTNDGKSFALEKCQNGYIFEEFDVHAFPAEEGELDGNFARALSPKMVFDRNEIVTYSVMFYYTPEFAATTPNVRDFVDQVVAETNQGYVNSQIPLRVKAFCTEQATVTDDESSSVVLTNFRNMKSSLEELRNSADAAALLVNKFDACGRGYLHTYASGLTLTVTQKSCALGYYSFGHELGHNFGATHNTETSTNSRFSYGHGHLINPTGASKWSGYRTIMAYFADGHYERVNYYSNPNVKYPGTGTPTGVADKSDNARVFVENRHSFAGLGDESGVCNDGSAPVVTTTTTTTTTAAPATGSCQTTGGEACNFPFSYSGNTYNECMEYYGNDWCRTNSGWGICSSSCYENATRGCETTSGETCNFPFSYYGVTYNGCMAYSGNNWCTTDSGWGICSNSVSCYNNI